jgi:hypothetical protein
MYWILAAAFLLIALLVPRLRVLGIVGCIIMGVMLGWGMVQRLRGTDPAQVETSGQQRGRPGSPAAELRAVPITLIDAEGLQLTGSGAPFELRGRIVNRSPDLSLKSVTIRLERRDCYEGALDPSGCVTLWADEHWIAVSVPPQSARDFADSIWMRGAAPRPRGTVRDQFRILAATGEADAASLERN